MVGRLVLLTEATALRESGSKERRNLQTHASVGGTRQSHIRVDGRTQGVPEGEHPGATSDPGKRSYSRLKLLVNEFILLRPFTGAVCSCQHPTGSPSAQADMAQPHRDAPTLSIHCTLADAQQQRPSAQEESPVVVVVVAFFFFLLPVCRNLDCKCNNFSACLL